MKPSTYSMLVTSTIFLSSSVFAGTMGMMQAEPKINTYVTTLSGGITWPGNGTTQTISLQPSLEKTYTASNSENVLASGELFLGWQRPLYSTLLGQLGVAFAGSSDAALQGDVWEDADPAFNNYTYKYQVNHWHVALKGKLLSDYWKQKLVIPYVSGSVGVGFNQAHSFAATPKIVEEVPAPSFGNNTATTFTYTVGAGFQHMLNVHWQASIGYEFADWGQSSLARAPGQTLNTGLQLNHLFTNQLQVSLTYLA